MPAIRGGAAPHYEGTIDFTGGKIHIKTTHNKKVQTSQVLIQFNTTEEELLNELLDKFESEKFVAIGANPNNKMEYYKGNNGCAFAVMPEAKVFNFIATMYKYVLTSVLSASNAKVLSKNASYSKLHSDIMKGFNVFITGKCKALTLKLSTKAPVVAKLSAGLSAIKPKTVADVKAVSENMIKPHDISGSKTARLYFVIFCQKFNFKISGNKLYCDDHTWSELIAFMKDYAPVAGGVITSYLKQAGSKKTKPSSNDTGGAKMNESNNEALAALNAIIEVTCILYGLPVETLTLASWQADKTALAEMKKMLK